MMEPEVDRYTLLYDGSCGICRMSASLLRHLPLRASVAFVDAADSRQLAAFPELTPQQALQSVHLKLPSSVYRRGYDAIVALVALIRGLRWMVPILKLRVSTRIGWAVYEWVTAHRHQISRLMLLE